jgi:hypothetical protein
MTALFCKHKCVYTERVGEHKTQFLDTSKVPSQLGDATAEYIAPFKFLPLLATVPRDILFLSINVCSLTFSYVII